MNYNNRLSKAIPGGAHTYSRGSDQYPANAPQILQRGKDAYVFDDCNNKFLDYGMALRAVNLGYANEFVNNAAIKQINFGNNLTRASIVELDAAERLIDLIDSVDMVKFTKNGSTAVSAAVKLARAYTGKELIIRCSQNPFLSYDDWFISSTPIKKGIPEGTDKMIKAFEYNDIESLKLILDKEGHRVACLIMEASTTEHPAPSKEVKGENFLHDVQRLCKKHNVVFVLDEMITGFRWHLNGAQKLYNIKPDLCAFGKAMANGFAVAAIGGKREIMELGGIDKPGAERVFLLSTTHGAEMCGLGAFLATVDFIQKNNVIEHIWDYGTKFIDLFNKVAKEEGISDYFYAGGVECSPIYMTLNKNKEADLSLRTLFAQEMISNKVLCPWIALSYCHGDLELQLTEQALRKSLKTYSMALEDGVDKYLVGDAIKPVFRRYN